MKRRKKSKGQQATAHPARRPGGRRRSHGRRRFARRRRGAWRPRSVVRRRRAPVEHREPPYYSSLWSVDVQGDDSVLFGGGGEYDYYGSYEDYFVGRLLPNGTPDASFAAAALNDTAVYDTTLQSDGKVVGVGTARQPDGKKKLLVFRLRPDGALDPDFGLGGLVIISDGSVKPRGGLFGGRRSGRPHRRGGPARMTACWSRGCWRTARWMRASAQAGFTSAPRQRRPACASLAAAAGGYRVMAYLAQGHGLGLRRGRSDGRRRPRCCVRQRRACDPAVAGRQVRCICSSLAVQSDGRILLGGVDD